jgi:hypothetical protein
MALARVPMQDPTTLRFQDKADRRKTEADLERLRLELEDRREQRAHERTMASEGRIFQLTVGGIACVVVLLAAGLFLYFGEKDLAKQIIILALPVGSGALGYGAGARSERRRIPSQQGE